MSVDDWNDVVETASPKNHEIATQIQSHKTLSAAATALISLQSTVKRPTAADEACTSAKRRRLTGSNEETDLIGDIACVSSSINK